MGNLSVIGGKVGGFNLKSVPGDRTRPVMSIVKEAVFNIVAPYILDSSWLDLFAGTGSVGIEALSRGADYACFLDNQRAAVDTIHANLDHTGLSEQADVWQTDAFGYLQGAPNRKYDFIYVAPPQYHGLWMKALDRIDQNPSWLYGDGWVIVQIDKTEYDPRDLENMHLFDSRKYGSTQVLFYALNEVDGA